MACLVLRASVSLRTREEASYLVCTAITVA
jgi:hypothetical protein